MRKTIIRKLGLTSCMLLAFLSGLPVAMISPAPAYAQAVPAVPTTLTRAQYEANPSSLLNNPAMLGANVRALQQQGVANNVIQQTLNSAGINPAQAAAITNVLNATGAGSVTDGLLTGVFAGTIPPDFADAVLNNPLFNSVTDAAQLINMLNDPAIKNALALFNNPGSAVDALLSVALGSGFNIQNFATDQLMGALTSAFGNALPDLVSTLGLGGLQSGLSNVLNILGGTELGGMLSGLAGIGGLGDLLGLGGALGGALPGGLGGIVGILTGNIPGNCACSVCTVQIPRHHDDIRTNITSEFEKERRWEITQFFMENILPALQLMAEQLTTAGMLQVEIIGTFLDAKHQLETQRIFQTLTARAHKDYHPSEGMCTFGTTVRSLAGSERRSNLAQTVYAQRMMQRQALNGQAISYQGKDSDTRARLKSFIENYCDQADNENGLNFLCRTAVADPARRDIDVDYTRNIESKLTLDMDFLPPNEKADGGGQPGNGTTVTKPDERDVFALAANLYSHNVAPRLMPELLAEKGGQHRVRQSAAEKYMDQRAIFAKRSVAQNSFAALVAMRTSGDPESAPYTKAIMRELGVNDDQEINDLLGKNPSYFAQMEVLTKKLYQNPVFYTELYDQPANIERKGAALQAIGLMQDRDLYNSLLRSEAVLSVLLETMLQKEQEKVTNAMGTMNPAGGAR